MMIPLFSSETFDDIVELARLEVNRVLFEASRVPEDQVGRVTFYLHMYALHMAARLGFNGHLNGCFKGPDDCITRMKHLLEIEHTLIKERHEDGEYFSMEEMHHGQTRKIRCH